MTVGEEAPEPFKGAETEGAEPQETEQNLGEEDGDGRKLNVDKAKGGAQTQTDAVEQPDAYERLRNVVGECHASWGCQPSECDSMGRAQVGEAYSYYIYGCHRNDAHGIEQRVDGSAPGMAADGTPCVEHRQR